MFAKTVPFFCGLFGIGSFYGAKYEYIAKKEKEKYLSEIMRRMNAESIKCPTSLSEQEIDENFKYQRVSLEGIIDDANTVIMGAKQAPGSTPHFKLKNPNTFGGYVYSPLITESGKKIIVNRGWIPKHELPQDPVYDRYINKNKENVNYRKFEGVISPSECPLFLEDAFSSKESKKENVDIDSTVWSFMDHDLINKRYSNGQKDFIVVDIVSPKNDYGEYPHRLRQDDIISMLNVPPHEIYSYSLFTTGCILFAFSYYLARKPYYAINKINRSFINLRNLHNLHNLHNMHNMRPHVVHS